MTHTFRTDGRAGGPAVGTTGNALGGAATSVQAPKGVYVGTIAIRVRTRLLSAPIQRGSVFVEVVITEGEVASAAAPADSADVMESAPVLWQGGSYVFTGHGATFHPNVFMENPGRVLLRVWNRDDLDSVSRIEVDYTVTFSARPVGGSDITYMGHESGTGTLRSVTGANPAAGSEVAITTPVGVVWRLISVLATLVASIDAATRRPELRIRDPADVPKYRGGQRVGHTASLTFAYDWAPASGFQGNLVDVDPLPEQCYVLDGWDIVTLTANLQAADDWSAPELMVEEWVVPAIAAS